MPYDLPDRFALARRSDAAFDVLEADVLAEKAASLGHRGRQVETALAALRAFDADGADDAAERLRLVRKAAHEVWAYFVQRELCGLRDHRPIIKDYGIPGEVLVRLGAVEKA
ncbi:MAG: DUF6665 family protein [Devosia sp.]